MPTTFASHLTGAVVAQLRADPTVAALLGETTTSFKVWADEAFASPAAGGTGTQAPPLPYLVHSQPAETVVRAFGNKNIGRGTFELAAFAATHGAAQDLLSACRKALNNTPVPQPVGPDTAEQLFFLRNVDSASRPVPDVPPGPYPAAYGRVMTFNYMITRSDV